MPSRRLSRIRDTKRVMGWCTGEGSRLYQEVLAMHEDNSCVFVVDDDQSTRESLRNLRRSTGLTVQTFASAQEFLARQRPACPS